MDFDPVCIADCILKQHLGKKHLFPFEKKTKTSCKWLDSNCPKSFSFLFYQQTFFLHNFGFQLRALLKLKPENSIPVLSAVDILILIVHVSVGTVSQ